MKTTTFLKRLEKASETTGIRKNTYAYKYLHDSVKWIDVQERSLTGMVIRPIVVRGKNWKSSSLSDYTFEFVRLLDAMRVKYERGNDAPRGGRTGAYIKITSKIGED